MCAQLVGTCRLQPPVFRSSWLSPAEHDAGEKKKRTMPAGEAKRHVGEQQMGFLVERLKPDNAIIEALQDSLKNNFGAC